MAGRSGCRCAAAWPRFASIGAEPVTEEAGSAGSDDLILRVIVGQWSGLPSCSGWTTSPLPIACWQNGLTLALGARQLDPVLARDLGGNAPSAVP